MYSDISNRVSSIPMVWASWRATSVLPTPVGPENKYEPIGLSGSRRPARASLIADASASIALSWPNTTRLRSTSSVFMDSLSERDTLFGGMRAILATTDSTSLTVISFLRRLSGTSIWAAPTSSITSMALSGSLRSLMYLEASSTAVRNAAAV